MSRNIQPFGLRLSEDLKIYLISQAQINHRSLNAEITARLEQSQIDETQQKLDKIISILESKN